MQRPFALPGVKYSGFGQENIPGFIPVYSGLF
jgi:hypothetical protein